jgi:hypothetical protein
VVCRCFSPLPSPSVVVPPLPPLPLSSFVSCRLAVITSVGDSSVDMEVEFSGVQPAVSVCDGGITVEAKQGFARVDVSAPRGGGKQTLTPKARSLLRSCRHLFPASCVAAATAATAATLLSAGRMYCDQFADAHTCVRACVIV